jgi:hypothetical protein
LKKDRLRVAADDELGKELRDTDLIIAKNDLKL